MRIRSMFIPVVLFAMCVLLPAPVLSEGAPKAVLVEPVHDVGKLDYGAETTHDFVVRNEGDAPLRILRVKSSCGCTAIDYDEEIAPGKSGKVKVLLETETQSGAFAVSLEAITNDTENPRLVMTLKAELVYYIAADPGYARYIIVQGFEGQGRVLQTVWPIDGRPMRILSVESPLDYVTTSFRRATEEERMQDVEAEQWIVETSISPDSPVGPITGFVRVTVEHPKQKVVMLPLHGFVRPIIAVTPPQVELGTLEVSDDFEARAHVKNFAAEEIEVTGVESSVPGIRAEIEEEAPGRVYYVLLTLDPETLEKGDFHGTLRIRTASPKIPVVEVPLSGTVL